MRFRIGLGLLPPDELCNDIKALELTIACQTNNFKGMTQPPHITLKRPFEISSKPDLDKFIAHLKTHKLPPVRPLSYSSANSFPEGSLYMAVSKNKSLTHIHQSILEYCAPFDIHPDQFEGANAVFHTTLAMELSNKQISDAVSMVEQSNILHSGAKWLPTKIGVFMFLPENNAWIVYDSIAI